MHDHAKFIVKVTGEPKPIVSWYKSQTLLTGDLYHSENYEDTYCFEIKDTQKTDAGQFTAVAQNSEGKAECAIDLQVNGKLMN